MCMYFISCMYFIYAYSVFAIVSDFCMVNYAVVTCVCNGLCTMQKNVLNIDYYNDYVVCFSIDIDHI